MICLNLASNSAEVRGADCSFPAMYLGERQTTQSWPTIFSAGAPVRVVMVLSFSSPLRTRFTLNWIKTSRASPSDGGAGAERSAVATTITCDSFTVSSSVTTGRLMALFSLSGDRTAGDGGVSARVLGDDAAGPGDWVAVATRTGSGGGRFVRTSTRPPSRITAAAAKAMRRTRYLLRNGTKLRLGSGASWGPGPSRARTSASGGHSGTVNCRKARIA